MTLLLDTHVIIWFRADPDRLGKTCMKRLRSRETRLLISVVSSLEVAQLVCSGKLNLPMEPKAWMKESFRILDALETPLTTEIAMDAYTLPEELHRDPADRILISTARSQNCQLVTADERILAYRHVRTFSAI